MNLPRPSPGCSAGSTHDDDDDDDDDDDESAERKTSPLEVDTARRRRKSIE